MRIELEAEKTKNLRLEQQLRFLSDKVKKSKSDSRQTSSTTNRIATLVTDNKVQVSTMNKNKDPQTKEINRSNINIPTINLTKQSKNNTAHSSQNHSSEDMQIPSSTKSFNHQLKDKRKHAKQCLLHTSIPNIKNQTTCEPSKRDDKRLDSKTTLLFHQQLKDYRTKQNSRRSILIEKYLPTKDSKETSAFGHNQQAMSTKKQHGNRKKEKHDKQSNFRQHPQAVPRPQLNASCRKSKPKNEHNIQRAPRSRQTQRIETGKMNQHTFFRSPNQ
jgi:hypothetical protein